MTNVINKSSFLQIKEPNIHNSKMKWVWCYYQSLIRLNNNNQFQRSIALLCWENWPLFNLFLCRRVFWYYCFLTSAILWFSMCLPIQAECCVKKYGSRFKHRYYSFLSVYNDFPIMEKKNSFKFASHISFVNKHTLSELLFLRKKINI